MTEKTGAVMSETNPHIGESFQSFLRDEGLQDEVVVTAISRTLALQSELQMAARENSTRCAPPTGSKPSD